VAGPASLLGVDVGTAFSKAALFEPVDGRYRLIARAQARTTSGSHVYEGLEKACAEIEALTGRQLFAGGEPLAGEVSGGRGVEELAVSVSCFRPLHVLATNAEAARAASGEQCHVQLLAGGTLRERAENAAASEWDALTGPADEVHQAMQYLGAPPAEASSQTGDVTYGQADVDGLAAVCGEGDAIRQRLAELALKLAQEQVAGLADLAAAATQPLETSASAVRELTRLVASRFGLRLTMADCGAAHVAVVNATPQDVGAQVVAQRQMLTDLPTTPTAMGAMHQTLQTALACCVSEGFSADLVVGAGALARFSRWGEAALTLLNGLRPAGVIQLALEGGGIAGPIASLARAFPDVACEVFERDGLVGLGAAVCPRGSLAAGAKAVDVRWRIGEQPEQQRQVKAGELVRIGLGPGEKAALTLYPAKQMDIGLNRPGVAAKASIDGGRVGLIVDAREPSARSEREAWEAVLA